MFAVCADSAPVHTRFWSADMTIHSTRAGRFAKAFLMACYLDNLALVERLHRLLLDVIKDEFERLQILEINSVQALLLFNIGENEVTAGELKIARLLSGLERQLQPEESWSNWATCTTSGPRSTAGRCGCG
jgi:hypothetical protein